MSDDVDSQAGLPEHEPAAGFAHQTAYEFVPRGLLFALVAVLGGIVLTVVVWRLGFVASLTSFALAAGAVFLYAKGAGAAPRKGLVPLIVLILAGVVASFFAVIASDAWDAYDAFVLPGTESRWTFISENVFRGEVLRSYGKDMAMFGLFAALGIFSIMRRLVASAA